MLYLLTGLYVIVSIFLVLVVLLQTGKRADLAGAFGGGGSQTAFGARGAATLLTKLTTASAVLFMVLALTLSILSSESRTGGSSVLEEIEPADTTGAPAAPVQTPASEAAPELPPLPAESPDTGGADAEPAADPAGGS